jgi:hypothetical protein
VVPGAFAVVEREWVGETTVLLDLPLRIRTERRFNESVALSRGPLLLALQLGEAWRQIGGELPAADWAVSATTPWAYALDLDPDRPEADLQIETRPLGRQPFSPDGTPLLVRVRGRRLPDWGLEHGVAAPPPPSPVSSDEPLEALTFVPYGATGLRMGELPFLRR